MQQRVALRMSDDGSEADGLETLEDFLRGTRDEKFGEFDQNVTLVINGVFCRMGQGIVDVFHGQVEIAPAMDARAGTGGRLQFGDLTLDQIRVESKLQVGVRRGDNIGGARLGRQAQHRYRNLESLGAIVETRQDVAMDIDQI